MEIGKEFLTYLRMVDPELKEEKIKPILKELVEDTIKFNINAMVNHILVNMEDFPSIKTEIVRLQNKIEEQKQDYILEQTDITYLRVLRGDLISFEQVYMRKIIPFPNNVYPIYWSVEKANKLIKEKKKDREYVAITSMNIDIQELNKEHLKTALHNKKPAIMIDFEPYRSKSYGRFLIDGNHRAYANSIKKTEYPVYILNFDEQFCAMHHPLFQYLYLLHFLFHLLQLASTDNSFELLILEPSSRYNVLKSLIKENQLHN